MNTKNINSILYIALIILLVADCGGGGGSGDSIAGGGAPEPDAGQEAPVLSSSQAFPSQLISVTHSSIQANDIVDVVFKTEETQATAVENDVSASVIPVKGIAAVDGIVDVAVPPFFDDSGLPISRDIRVLVNGIPSASTLRVEGLLEFDVPTGGMILGAFLSLAIDNYSNAIEDLNTISSQLSSAVAVNEAQAAISTQLSVLQAQLDEITQAGTLTVEVDGLITVLSQEQLELVDRWLLHSLISMEVANQQAVGGIITAAQHQPDPYEAFQDGWARAKKALADAPQVSDGVRQTITEGFPDVLNKGREALKTGATYLGGFLSMVTGGAGLLGDKPLKVAAAATNIAAAQSSALLSTVNAWWARQNTDNFLNGTRDGFDLGQELISQMIRLGSAYLGAAGSKLADAVNTGLTVKDVLSEAEVEVCQTQGSPSLLCAGGEVPTTTFIIKAYLNFDGTLKTAAGGLRIGGEGLDPQEADIRLSGNPAFPTMSWSGNGITLSVIGAFDVSFLYVIFSASDADTNNLIPFRPPVRYGDYSIRNIETAESDLVPLSAPALQPQKLYEVNVQRSSDFKTASLIFYMN